MARYRDCQDPLCPGEMSLGCSRCRPQTHGDGDTDLSKHRRLLEWQIEKRNSNPHSRDSVKKLLAASAILLKPIQWRRCHPGLCQWAMSYLEWLRSSPLNVKERTLMGTLDTREMSRAVFARLCNYLGVSDPRSIFK